MSEGVARQWKERLREGRVGSPKGGRSHHRSPIFQRGSGITKPSLTLRKLRRRAAKRRLHVGR